MKLLKGNSIRRAAVAPALGILLGSALSIAVGTTASASEAGATARPTDCRYLVSNNWQTEATCGHHNGGSYRAVAVCTEAESGRVQHFYGNWKQSGPSFAYCNGAYRTTSAGIETSASNHAP
ncbi:hypothetical protein ACFCXT_37965 [Streptomyces vinaceus]|uniref:hypothetical protein n=1 Tax=Streptomyces vinaceus TaxID=1960 RepID=UPI0035E13A9E